MSVIHNTIPRWRVDTTTLPANVGTSYNIHTELMRRTPMFVQLQNYLEEKSFSMVLVLIDVVDWNIQFRTLCMSEQFVTEIVVPWIKEHFDATDRSAYGEFPYINSPYPDRIDFVFALTPDEIAVLKIIIDGREGLK